MNRRGGDTFCADGMNRRGREAFRADGDCAGQGPPFL